MQILNGPTAPAASNGQNATSTTPALTASKTIKTLTAVFDLKIYPRQLPAFRGAVAELAGWQNDLFHNHKGDDGLYARYPLIQYRIKNGRAAIFAMQEGVAALQDFLMSGHTTLKMQGRYYPMAVLRMAKQDYELRLAESPQAYKLFKWLPLNPENYGAWQQCSDLVERIHLLERILSSQLVGFCACMDWRAPERVAASIQHLQLMEKVKAFNVQMLSFNITYTSNLVMPEGIGLGKAVSHGFGWQVPAAYSFGAEGFDGKDKKHGP